MKPTMKLRWKQFNGFGMQKFSLAAHCISGTDTYFVLQQLWEEQVFETFGGAIFATEKVKSEWRDIPIEVEE